MPPLKPVPIASLPTQPWKNAGGFTRELAAAPPGAGLEDFDWRLSLADIQPGEFDFSRFPGVDRLTIVLGPGLSLGTAGAPRQTRHPVQPLELLQLDGETALQATLEGSAVQAFNLMLRRGRARGTIAACTSTTQWPAAQTMLALCCMQGQARVQVAGQGVELPAGSLLRVEQAPSASALIEVATPRTLVLVATVDSSPVTRA